MDMRYVAACALPHLPFDIEELKLRVQNAIARAERESLTDPRSGLPSGRLIEEELRRIIREDEWALMDIRVNHFGPFKDEYGFVAGDDVLRFTAMTINEIVDTHGTTDDFIGHAGEDNFVVITKPVDNAKNVKCVDATPKAQLLVVNDIP